MRLYEFLRSKNCKLVTAGLLLPLYLNLSIFPAYAEVAAAKSAKDLAGSLPSLSVTGSGAVSWGNGASIDMNTVYPQSQTSSSSMSELEGVYGNELDTIKMGNNANYVLSTENSLTGDAYRTVKDSSQRTSVDLSKDPIFNTQMDVYANLNEYKEILGDCSKTIKTEIVDKKNHIPDYKQCSRVTDASGTSTLIHNYDAGLIEYMSGDPNIQSCGEGCLYLWVGTVGDNYLSGWCTVYEQVIKYRVLSKQAVISAHLDYIQWDDYAEVYLNDERIWLNPVGFFPESPAQLPPGYSCEYVGNLGGTGTLTGGGVDITESFKTADDVQTLKMRVSVGDKGEIYARIKIIYDPSKIISKDTWEGEEALKTIDAINNGMCSSHSYTCESKPALNPEGCTEIGGTKICESYFKPSPIEGISPMCKNVTVSAQCSFYTGDLTCYTDVKGNRICPENTGGNLNSCAAYESNPSCGFISQKCIPGTEGSKNGCFAFDEVWDCGSEVSTPTVIGTGETISCEGGVQCMNGDCVQPVYEQSEDFNKAVAALQVLQYAEADLDCGDNEDINNTKVCTLFKGEAMECLQALGGWQDCCDQPVNTNWLDYVKLSVTTLSLANKTGALDGIKSYGVGVLDGVKAAGSEFVSPIVKPVVSGLDTIMGSSNSAATALDQGVGYAIDTVVYNLQEKIAMWVAEQFGAAAANTIFVSGSVNAAGTFETAGSAVSTDASTGAVTSNAGSGSVIALNPAIAAMMSAVAIAYMVYQIADMLVKMVWQCSETDFTLAVKRETKLAVYVGSYCAKKTMLGCIEKRKSYCVYNSQVGRIIQEQGREQLGITWGDPETPECRGLTIDEFSQIDFAKLDLSEWIGSLYQAGVLETSYNFDNLTGPGSVLNSVSEGGSRENTQQRTINNMKDMDFNTIKNDTEKGLRTK